MFNRKSHTGFAIAIAWPETFCKQPGYWYDNFCNALGFSTNHYYKVGHAAIVLINSVTKQCHYFDFGRYHTPFQHGRVRSEVTDHKLKVNTSVSDNTNTITNFEEILTELQNNAECHGEGAIHASYCAINFDRAMQKALQLQAESPIPYGPFKHKGSNCSRFVNTCIVAGKPNWIYTFKLKYAIYLTPTPMNNVKALQNKKVIPKLLTTPHFCPASLDDKQKLKQTLAQPTRPSNIPTHSHWLSGEGAGSWFVIEAKDGQFQISRYNPEGKLECSGNFEPSNNKLFNPDQAYHFSHLSHCQKVVLVQANQEIIFERIS